MTKGQSFIDVRSASVSYPIATSIFSRLAGRKSATHSVLRNVNLQLNQGDWVTVFGGPGAGKSTLLRLLAGGLKANHGTVRVNGNPPWQSSGTAAAYVSSEESEPATETVSQVLHSFGRAHDIHNLPAKIGATSQVLSLNDAMYRPAESLSTVERLRVNIARAALSDFPLVLFDDVADQIPQEEFANILDSLFQKRTVIIATRSPQVAEHLNIPILLLHKGTLAHFGTPAEIAHEVNTPRLVDVWLEGIRYDLFRAIKDHPGVIEARLLPDGRFAGQRMRIKLKSSRYLPAMYDIVSQGPLVRVEELPPTLNEIISKLR